MSTLDDLLDAMNELRTEKNTVQRAAMLQALVANVEKALPPELRPLWTIMQTKDNNDAMRVLGQLMMARDTMSDAQIASAIRDVPVLGGGGAHRARTKTMAWKPRSRFLYRPYK